jgi:hypothetical protein
MALLDDVLKPNPAAAVGLGVLALALPVAFPALRPQLAAVAKAGIKLFLEAEFGASGELMDRFVDETVDALLQVTSSGTEAERKRAAEAAVHEFKATARRRARRHGWDEEDARRRYDRQLAKLRRRLDRERLGAHPATAAALDHAVGMVQGDGVSGKTSGRPAAASPTTADDPSRL